MKIQFEASDLPSYSAVGKLAIKHRSIVKSPQMYAFNLFQVFGITCRALEVCWLQCKSFIIIYMGECI